MSEQRYLSLNWVPDSFGEFRSSALAGRVELNIEDQQYPWLYENIIPYKLFRSTTSYKSKLLKKMIADETIFRKVHDQGIDLVLLREGGS